VNPSATPTSGTISLGASFGALVLALAACSTPSPRPEVAQSISPETAPEAPEIPGGTAARAEKPSEKAPDGATADAAGTAQPLSPVAAASAALLGDPLIVHGRRITDEEIERYLCYSAGSKDIDMLKFSILTRQEIEKRRQAGATPEDLARYEVSEDELTRRMRSLEEDFLLRYPTLDFPTEVSRAELSIDLFRERLRQTMIFDKVFRPDDPEEWPELTRAIIADQLGEQWLDDERVSYAARLRKLFESQRNWLGERGHGPLVDRLVAIQIADTTAPLVEAVRDPEVRIALDKLREAGLGDIPADDPIAVETTRGTILQQLNTYAVVRIDPDEIAADLRPQLGAAADDRARSILMTVEGVPITIEQVWSRIAPYVKAEQIEEARRYLALTALLERDLEQKGTLMPQSEFREWWPATAKQNKYTYIEFLNQHDMLSSQVLGFPSLWAFANYERLRESYRRSMATELADDQTLMPLLPTISQIAGAAKLSVNVILLSAYDFANDRWKENGWADAKARALEVKKALDGGADWQSTLELHSEFFDFPMPEVGAKPMHQFTFKGTFGNEPQTRSQLVNVLMESEFRMFLYGPSVADYIFFEQKMGSIEGPFRGPKGYYISRITGKTPPTRPLDVRDPVHREILVYHYVNHAMGSRALSLLSEALKSGDVKGLDERGDFRTL
jgi:hypothetical protein